MRWELGSNKRVCFGRSGDCVWLPMDERWACPHFFLPHSLSFARITLGRLGGANQVLTPITSFSGCGRRPEGEEGMCSHLSQSLTPSFTVVCRKQGESITRSKFHSTDGWLVARPTQATKHPIVPPLTPQNIYLFKEYIPFDPSRMILG